MANSKFMDHWVEIGPERLERYETMYRWSRAAEDFYAPARIGAGQVVADFGCGPGHAAVEFARIVGAGGHVHALDINADFIAGVKANAAAEGFSDRITPHLLKDAGLPLADAQLDRIVTRNTLVYVANPAAIFREFRRVLKPGGLAHAIEGDWSLTIVEPLGTEWAAMVEAASWVWRTPEMGRALHGAARAAGFSDIALQVLTNPDMDGRLHGMIKNVAGYALESGKMDSGRIKAALKVVDKALAERTYLAVAPQFVVTAIA